MAIIARFLSASAVAIFKNLAENSGDVKRCLRIVEVICLNVLIPKNLLGGIQFHDTVNMN